MFKLGGQTIPLKALFLVATDSVLIVVGILLGAALRFHDMVALRIYLHNPEIYWQFGFVLLVCQVMVYYYDLYDYQVVSRHTILFVQSLQALGVACFVLG